jgi:hypothetical protein
LRTVSRRYIQVEPRQQREAAHRRAATRCATSGAGGHGVVGRLGAAAARRSIGARSGSAHSRTPRRRADASHSSRFQQQQPSKGTSRVLRSAIVQYSVTARVASDAERVEHRGERLVVHVAQQALPGEEADQADDAADVDGQHAARQGGDAEEDPPSASRFGSSTVRYGATNGARRVGPSRSGSRFGSSVPANTPTAMLENTTSSTTTAPTNRPPRYCHFVIGAAKKNDSVRYSKSCWTARPHSAAITVEPNSPRKPDRLRDRVRRVDPDLAAAEDDVRAGDRATGGGGPQHRRAPRRPTKYTQSTSA